MKAVGGRHPPWGPAEREGPCVDLLWSPTPLMSDQPALSREGRGDTAGAEPVLEHG